jgi:hypothetical protein
MHRDIDELGIEFNFQAKETYYSLYVRFTNVARALNRDKDENVFQLTRSQYCHAMKSELEKIAMSVIEKNLELQDVTQLKRNLTNRINDYLQEFMMKSQTI